MPWSFVLPQAIFASPLLATLTPIATGSTVGYLVNRAPRHKTKIPHPAPTPGQPTPLALPARLDAPLRPNGVRVIPLHNAHARAGNNRPAEPVHRAAGPQPPLDAAVFRGAQAGSRGGGYGASWWDGGRDDAGAFRG
ncbi:uncharacterized protein DSM5745_09853 [Aspergillus mulundensis]|uniref:Uncharacterized protein n=1 Tax=Aspergillus mulundensis TaxID=1810919 RepID=A0A3D8QRL8_9EURO|nr:hypothetical protein DSM5745_09853 [Aspergillus mulundensis]RDW64442.1 hypothetical protein DSM5745_09853 [Aspergillus mulundensis]